MPKGQKERRLIQDYKKIDKKTFGTDLKSTNWNQILKLNLGNTNDSFEIFFETFNKIMDKHAPLRKLFIQKDTLKKSLDYPRHLNIYNKSNTYKSKGSLQKNHTT